MAKATAASNGDDERQIVGGMRDGTQMRALAGFIEAQAIPASSAWRARRNSIGQLAYIIVSATESKIENVPASAENVHALDVKMAQRQLD